MYENNNFIDVWLITSECSGPCIGKTNIIDDEPIGKNDDLGTLVRKYQKCGKKCKTCTEGKGHGPYYWRVKYIGKNKAKWTFIGKNV